MLREFVEKKHYLFAKEAKDWEDAIIMSCKSLEADGTVESNYAHDIVECVRKYGPYIVIMPNIAMPHSQEGAVGVNKTAIGFIAFGVPPILVLLALIVFVRKFKLYGDLADKVHAYIVDRERKRTDGE